MKNKISFGEMVFILISAVMLLSPILFFHESLTKYLDNILNGSFAIIPATVMVIWQVRKENEARNKEIEVNHREEIERINRNHREKKKE